MKWAWSAAAGPALIITAPITAAVVASARRALVGMFFLVLFLLMVALTLLWSVLIRFVAEVDDVPYRPTNKRAERVTGLAISIAANSSPSPLRPNPEIPMNPAVLARAQQITAELLANVRSDQLDDATPCAKWNVGQLIDHIIGSQYWATAGIQGNEMSGTGEGASAGDFTAEFAVAATAALDAFREDGALTRTVNPGFGDMPAMALLGLAITDTFTHAWDLATATGQDNNLDPELAAQLLEASRQSIQPAFRSEAGEIFGLEQPAPDDANPATALASFLGRSV